MLPIGHDGTDACRRTIDANLDGWLECSRRTEATDPAWFRLGARLGALAFDRLGLGAGSCDPLGAALRDPEVRVRFGAGGPPLEALDRLADAYDAVRDEIDVARATEPVTDAPVESAALVHRLALLLAAGAFAGVCAERGDDAITADPLVREACLRRIEDRLAGRVGALEPHLVERLVALRRGSHRSRHPLDHLDPRRCAAPGAGGRRHPMNTDAMTIEAWLEGRVVAYGKVDAGSFTPETPLAELGLDSVYALTLCGDIEDEFALEVDPTIVWDHPTIRSLAHGISDRLAAAA